MPGRSPNPTSTPSGKSSRAFDVDLGDLLRHLYGGAFVLALNCLFWRWRIPRSPRLTGAGIAGWVAALSARYVVVVTFVFVLISTRSTPNRGRPFPNARDAR